MCVTVVLQAVRVQSHSSTLLLFCCVLLSKSKKLVIKDKLQQEEKPLMLSVMIEVNSPNTVVVSGLRPVIWDVNPAS